VVLEKNGEYHLVRSVSNEVLQTANEEGNVLHTIKRKKAEWTGNVLHGNCFIKTRWKGRKKRRKM